MKYSTAISEAMKRAKKSGKTFIVFGIKKRWWFGYSYHYGDEAGFLMYIYESKWPVVKFMIITAKGRAVR